jgi:hypothetical protein
MPEGQRVTSCTSSGWYAMPLTVREIIAIVPGGRAALWPNEAIGSQPVGEPCEDECWGLVMAANAHIGQKKRRVNQHL